MQKAMRKSFNHFTMPWKHVLLTLNCTVLCAIKFRAIKYGLIQDSLELSGIDKNAQGQSYWEQCKNKLFSSYQPHGTRARQPMTYRPVNPRRGFSRDEWASIVNAVTKHPILGELEIEVQRDIDSTIIEDLLSRLPALRVLGLQIWTGFSEACIPEVAKSIRRMKTLERLVLYSRRVLNYGEPGGMESILIEHLFPTVSSPNVSEIEDQSMLNELQWRYRGPIPWRYKCLYEVVIILLRNSRLKTVELHEQVYTGENFWSYEDLIGIFETLQGNKFLKKLDMTFSGIKVKESDEDVSREIVGNLLDLVGHDFYVEEICFPLQLCDEFQRVVTQVKKNAADALKGMELINPISSRVFLCGLPYAGKTQLRTTFGKEPTTFGKKREFLKQLIYPDKDIPHTRV